MAVINHGSTGVLPIEDEEPGNGNALEIKVQSPVTGVKTKRVNRKRKLPDRKQRLVKRMKQMKDKLTEIKKQRLKKLCKGSYCYTFTELSCTYI